MFVFFLLFVVKECVVMAVFEWFRADCDQREVSSGTEIQKGATQHPASLFVWMKALVLVLVPLGVYVDLVTESGVLSSAPIEVALLVWTVFIALLMAVYHLLGAWRRQTGRVDG